MDEKRREIIKDKMKEEAKRGNKTETQMGEENCSIEE